MFSHVEGACTALWGCTVIIDAWERELKNTSIHRRGNGLNSGLVLVETDCAGEY